MNHEQKHKPIVRREQEKPNRISTISRKDQTNFPLATNTNRKWKT